MPVPKKRHDDEPEALMTSLDVSFILKVSTQTVRNMVARGELSTVPTVRGQHLYRRADVEVVAAKRKGPRGTKPAQE